MRRSVVMALLFVAGVLASVPAHAQERLCDASAANCRSGQGQGLLDLINKETQAIDVGVWFWKDYRYVTALVNAKKRGVAVRIIMDPRANAQYPTNAGALNDLAAAGIPMRKRIAGDICHWKLMIFVGQGIVEWSGANFSPTAFVPQTPYKDYEDEVIYFSRQLLSSFQTMYDNIWTNTVEYANYANVSGTLVRVYPLSPIDPRLNFPPKDAYQDRLIPLIDREPAQGGLIDVDMYRITLARPVDALIRAAARGVRIRMYLEPNEYANTARPGNKVQMDRLVAAAAQYPGTIEIRMRKHLGINHQKTIWFHAQHVVVFGTSNWSDASDDNQLEANIFTDRVPGDPLNDSLFSDLHEVFERKWNNLAPDGSIETEAWRTPTLPPPVLSDKCLDPNASNRGAPLPCQYPPPPPPPPPPQSGATTVVIWPASHASITGGNWQLLSDSTAAGETVLWNPNANKAKVAPALAAPASYVEADFSAMSGTAYHIWARLRAQDNLPANDSIHVQFSDAVTGPGSTTGTLGIGTTSSAEFIIQDGATANGPDKWGWTDNGWGTFGDPIYFATNGTHRLRIQAREDGAMIDQIVLSPDTYFSVAPGAGNNDLTILPETPRPGDPTCSQTVSPTTASVTSDGGTVTVTVTDTGSCTWSATTDAAWITIASGATGTGSGSASLTVAPNTDTAPRTGTVTIAGTTVTLSQDASTACTYTLSSSGTSLPANGGAPSVDVATGPSCTWSASSVDPWVVITNGGPGAGSGTVVFNVQANGGASRTATLTIAGRTYTVAQAAPAAASCVATLSASGTSIGSDGGSGTVGATIDESCGWSASSSASWLVITSAATGTGNGSVSFTADANTGAARTATLTIGGATYAVAQAAAPAPACAVTLDKTALLVGGPEANWSIIVTASDSTCTWTATSDSAWLVVRSTAPMPMPVSGSGSVKVRALVNTGGPRRVGHVIINGAVYTVTQTGT